MSMITNR